MEERTFVWDEEKQIINIKKHGITFIEAATVFDDEGALIINDPDHSQYEDRFIKYLDYVKLGVTFRAADNLNNAFFVDVGK